MAEIDDFVVVDDNNTGRWPEGMPASSVNNAGRADEGILARWYKDTNGSLVSTGSANAYVVTLNRTGISALTDGFPVTFEANFANTGAATLNVNAIGAKDIRKSVDTALSTGDILSGQKVMVSFDLDNDFFQLITAIPTGAQTNIANTFTENQTIQSTDGGATNDPILILDRDSASPAASDLMGEILFRGEDDGGNDVDYGALGSQIVDPTNTSKDGRLYVRTIIADSEATRLYIGAGLYTPNASGGDQGIDTANLSAVYKDGEEYARPWTKPSSIAVSSGSSVTLLSGLDGEDIQEIEINLLEVSPSTQATLQFQIGPAAGVETTGYSGKGGSTSSSTSVANNSNAFNVTALNVNYDGADEYVGNITLRRYDSDTWSLEAFGSASTGAVLFGMGRKTISGDIDILDILLSTGNFDGSGTALVRYR